jgi:hypothetical protein
LRKVIYVIAFSLPFFPDDSGTGNKKKQCLRHHYVEIQDKKMSARGWPAFGSLAQSSTLPAFLHAQAGLSSSPLFRVPLNWAGYIF